MFTNAKKMNKEEVSNSSNIIGQGTSLEGSLDTTGNLRIEGKVIGKIATKAKLVLGNTAWIKGNIIAQNAEVGGEVQGTIEVTELLTLKPTAVVHGDIITSKLVFEEGAKFNGKCKMGKQAQEISSTPKQAHHKSSDPATPPMFKQEPQLSKKA